ncbi:hypothetical protein EJB05_05304, partial [Eragrostis curvula]
MRFLAVVPLFLFPSRLGQSMVLCDEQRRRIYLDTNSSKEGKEGGADVGSREAKVTLHARRFPSPPANHIKNVNAGALAMAGSALKKPTEHDSEYQDSPLMWVLIICAYVGSEDLMERNCWRPLSVDKSNAILHLNWMPRFTIGFDYGHW